MSTKKAAPAGSADTVAGLEQLLAERPSGFSFFQAVRLMEQLHPEREGVGGWGDPTREVVRFTVSPALAHPVGEIRSLTPVQDEAPGVMDVHMMGMVGPSGVLPHEYTRLTADRERQKDSALKDFLDLFHHRLISLFYLAWRKNRADLHFESAPAGGGVPRHLLDLLGLGLEPWQDRLDIPDEVLIHYAGLLGPQPRGAVALRQLLQNQLGIQVQVQEFVGGWFRLRANDLCHLGSDDEATRLGQGAVVGDEVWDPQSRVRLRLGPMDRETFDRLLPGGDLRTRLASLVRFFGQEEHEFEICLVLKAEDVRGVELGEPDAAPPRLGWGTWLQSRPRHRDGDETTMTL